VLGKNPRNNFVILDIVLTSKRTWSNASKRLTLSFYMASLAGFVINGGGKGDEGGQVSNTLAPYILSGNGIYLCTSKRLARR
jgi:hypothetical protein